MAPVAFKAWLARGNPTQSMAAQGAARFRQYGCSGCHDANATVHAPKLAGLFGKPVQLEGGRTITADERYIRDAVLLPHKEITAGYAPIMPTFQGQLSEEDLLAIIEYIKSLKDSPQGDLR